MLPAPSLNDVLQHRERHPEALCCLLFAPPFSKPAKEGVIPRLGYLHHRSGDFIHFYCAGYGAYWHKDEFPDMEAIDEVPNRNTTDIPWAFSQKVFSEFVNELEKATKWRYSGETEAIVLNARSSFEDCLILNIEHMVKDNAINGPSELFESLIRYSKSPAQKSSIYEYSDGKMPGLFGDAIINVLCEGPQALRKTWEAGRHFAIKNIAK